MKIIGSLEIASEELDASPKSSILQKKMLKDVANLAKCFDLLNSAALEDNNAIFYQKQETKDVQLLLQAMRYHEPSDVERHMTNMRNGLNTVKYAFAVASQALTSNYLACQLFTAFRYATYYK